MFRGKEKPLAFLNGRGVAITNREISNLGDAITKNAQKHYLITDGKGRQKESHLQGLLRICHKCSVVFIGFHSCDILLDLSCVGISAFWVMELDSLVGIV